MSDYSLIGDGNGTSVIRRDGDHNVVVAGGMSHDEAVRLLAQLSRKRTIRVGDCFEWIAFGAFVTAAYLQYVSIPLALAVFGVGLVYEAQCLATAELRWPKLPKVRLSKVKVGRLIMPITFIYRKTSFTLRNRLARLRGDREHAPPRNPQS